MTKQWLSYAAKQFKKHIRDELYERDMTQRDLVDCS